LKTDLQIYDLKGHRRCLLITVSDFTFENGFILVGCVGFLIVPVVFRIFCCDLSEKGFKDKLSKYLLGMGDLKLKYISDMRYETQASLSSLPLNKLVYACYHNVFYVCLLNEGLLFSPAGLSLQLTFLAVQGTQFIFSQ
jgi:hypothetical protein